MDVYYAQRDFREQNGRWAASLAELNLPQGAATGAARLIGLESAGEGYLARAEVDLPGGPTQRLTVDHESRIRME